VQGVFLEKLVLIAQKISNLEPSERMALMLEHLLKLSIREIRRMHLQHDTDIWKQKRESLEYLESKIMPQIYAFKMKVRKSGDSHNDMELRWARQEAYEVLVQLILNIAGIDYQKAAA
jgi:hypothetical protein